MRTVITLFVVLLSSCRGVSHHSKIPKKAEGIPSIAFWAGGVDGGNWYLIDSFSKSRKEASIKVYNDNSGELLVSKTFKMDCINEDGINWNNLKEQISFFDGQKILLEIKGKGGSRRYCYFE